MIFTQYMILLTMIFMIIKQNKNMDSYDLHYMYDSSDYDLYDPNAK